MPHPRRELLAVLAILVTAAGVYLAGNAAVPLIDRDEPRYAQCSREMLAGSPEHPGRDLVVPRLMGQTRTAKPPLIYWCQAGVMSLLGDTPFAARLPSAVAMTLTLAMWAAALWRTAGPKRAVVSTLILASSVLAVLAAKWCTTDALLLLFLTAAQWCVYAMWRGRWGWWTVIALGVAVGLAGLTKGPVVLGVIATTLLAARAVRPNAATEVAGPIAPRSATSLAALKVLLAIAVVAAIVVPWLLAIHHREPGFLPRVIGHDVLRRSLRGLEGHGAPSGYYLLTIWGTYLPWSIALPLAAVHAWRRRHVPLVRFALAAVVGPWLMFEIVWTKLPHYLLPVFPWLALLTADALVRRWRVRTVVAVGGGSFAAFAILFGLVLPRASSLRMSIAIADELKRRGLTGAGEVVMLGYKEPSLAFYQGGTIRQHSNMALTPGLAPLTPRHLVISDAVWQNTSPGERERYDVLATFRGFNVAEFEHQTVYLVKRN